MPWYENLDARANCCSRITASKSRPKGRVSKGRSAKYHSETIDGESGVYCDRKPRLRRRSKKSVLAWNSCASMPVASRSARRIPTWIEGRVAGANGMVTSATLTLSEFAIRAPILPEELNSRKWGTRERQY